MHCAQQKNILRLHAQKKRTALSCQYRQKADAEIVKKIVSLDFLQDVIALYMPIHQEVNPLAVTEEIQKKITFALPTIQNNKMIFCHWDKQAPLEKGPLNILQPVNKKPLIPTFFLIPLLAFTPQGARLGYGKGYYDRYLNQHKKQKKLITIGLGYECQKYAILPYEPHDVLLDVIITEKKIYNRKKDI